MKVIPLILLSVALSSCACKPWMVGSRNDTYKMKAYAAGKKVELPEISEPAPGMAVSSSKNAKSVTNVKKKPASNS